MTPPQPPEHNRSGRGRRLAAILAADIAGYSRLMGEDESATVRDLKGHQAAVLRLVGRYGGRSIDTAGRNHLFLESEPAFAQLLEQTRAFLAS